MHSPAYQINFSLFEGDRMPGLSHFNPWVCYYNGATVTIPYREKTSQVNIKLIWLLKFLMASNSHRGPYHVFLM